MARLGPDCPETDTVVHSLMRGSDVMRLLPQHGGDWVISLNKMAGEEEAQWLVKYALILSK